MDLTGGEGLGIVDHPCDDVAGGGVGEVGGAIDQRPGTPHVDPSVPERDEDARVTAMKVPRR